MGSLYGHIADGILVMPDGFAVLFLSAAIGSLPSIWALVLRSGMRMAGGSRPI